MKQLILIVLFVLSLHAEGGVKKVVYDLTTGSLDTFSRVILSGIVFQKNHYESKMEDLHVVVVIHGEAYKFFLQSPENTPYAQDNALSAQHEEIARRIESLHTHYGVTFRMCEIGMKKRSLEISQMVSSVELAPSSTVALIDAQNDGYAYIPVH